MATVQESTNDLNSRVTRLENLGGVSIVGASSIHFFNFVVTTDSKGMIQTEWGYEIGHVYVCTWNGNAVPATTILIPAFMLSGVAGMWEPMKWIINAVNANSGINIVNTTMQICGFVAYK